MQHGPKSNPSVPVISAKFLLLANDFSEHRQHSMIISTGTSIQFVTSTFTRSVRFSSTTPSLQSSRIYCQNLLRKHDYPSYLQIPFIPQSARDAHLAIHSLNAEIALIPDIVSNKDARRMRMEFWKDAVENCFQSKPKAEPVSILLTEALSSGTRLTKSFLQTIVSERV